MTADPLLAELAKPTLDDAVLALVAASNDRGATVIELHAALTADGWDATGSDIYDVLRAAPTERADQLAAYRDGYPIWTAS